MSISLANGKKAKLLEQVRAYLNTLEYHLFVNAHVPADADTVVVYSEPADTGYAKKSAVGFTASYLNGLNQGETDAPNITFGPFTLSAGGFTIQGYYVVDPADGALVYAEAATTPFTVSAVGQSYTIQPKVTDNTLS